MISTKQKQQLKAKAHKLKPIILIGNQGLTQNVLLEIDRALNDHELIKIRIHSNDRIVRKTLFTEISVQTNALIIQIVGSIGVFYRPSQEK